tara:strand:- start:62 stop:277 length:216 start_codon:yes stop_codon:yes gene_type:complete
MTHKVRLVSLYPPSLGTILEEGKSEHKVQVEITSPGGIVLDDLLEEFETFIRAMGYCPKGTLQFVEEDWEQ